MQVFQIKLKYHWSKPIKLQKILYLFGVTNLIFSHFHVNQRKTGPKRGIMVKLRFFSARQRVKPASIEQIPLTASLTEIRVIKNFLPPSDSQQLLCFFSFPFFLLLSIPVSFSVIYIAIGSVGRAPVCWAGGYGFEPRTAQTSGSLNNWEESAAFVMTSANG